MDPELRALMQRFQSVQREEAPRKLNERNTVEIIGFLQRSKLLELVYSADGRQILTFQQLLRDIEKEVDCQSGRVAMCDLPGLLNVDMNHIERAVPRVLEINGSFTLLDGELISGAFFEGVLDDIVSQLQHSGCVPVTAVARSARLPSVFLSNRVDEWLRDGRLKASLDDGVLFTPLYVALQKRKALCVLAGITQPVSIAPLLERHGLNATVFSRVVEQLCQEGKLLGRMEAGRYSPQIYDVQRDAAVNNLYSSNGWVTYAAIAALGVSHPKSYLLHRYNGEAATAAATSAGKSTGAKGGRGKRGAATAATTGAESGAPAVVAPSSEQRANSGFPLSTLFVSRRKLDEVLVRLASLESGDALTIDLTECLPAQDIDSADDWEVLTGAIAAASSFFADECRLVPPYVVHARKLWQNVEPLITAVVEDDLRAPVPKSPATPAAAGGGSSKKGAAAESAAVKALSKEAESRINQLLLRSLRVGSDQGDLITSLMELDFRARIDKIWRASVAASQERGNADLKKVKAARDADAAALWSTLRAWEAGLAWAESSGLGDAVVSSMQKHAHTVATDLIRLAMIDLLSPELAAKVAADAVPRSLITLAPKADQPNFTAIANSLQVKDFSAFLRKAEELWSSNVIGLPLKPVAGKAERELLKASVLRDVEAACAVPQTFDRTLFRNRVLPVLGQGVVAAAAKVSVPVAPKSGCMLLAAALQKGPLSGHPAVLAWLKVVEVSSSSFGTDETSTDDAAAAAEASAGVVSTDALIEQITALKAALKDE